MRTRSPRRLAVPLAVTAALMLACSGSFPTSQFDDANKKKGPSTSKDALDGKEFNKFFPTAAAPFDLVYKQEKKGVAIAELKKDGKVVAQLSVTDILTEPQLWEEKYKDSKEKISDYPVAKSDSDKETAVLVAERFQVKVRTMPPATNATFGEDDRREWIKKFKLDGLAKLAK
jgi:hypothetical protein